MGRISQSGQTIGYTKPVTKAATLAIQDPSKQAPTAPALVGQPAPPPSSTPSIDPVTGAKTPPLGAPPPVTPAVPPVPPPTEGLTPSGSGTTPQATAAAERAAKVREGSTAPVSVDLPDANKNTSNDALDNALRALNLSRIEGASNVDTTEAESLIRDLMQRQLGAQQVGQRASMGRAGFASSGALAGMESDAQQQAAQNAQREILGLRRSEDQRAFDNAQDAAGTDLDYRRFGSDDEIRRAQLKALQDYLGLPGADEPGADGPSAAEVGNSLWFGGRSGRGGTDDVDVGNYVDGENVGNQQTDAGEGETIRAGQTDYLVKEGKVSEDDVSMPPHRVTVNGVEYRTFRDPYGNAYVVKA